MTEVTEKSSGEMSICHFGKGIFSNLMRCMSVITGVDAWEI
jgi:hypothetical protein